MDECAHCQAFESSFEEFNLEDPTQASALHERLNALVGKLITFDFPSTRGRRHRIRSTETLKAVVTAPDDIGWGTYMMVDVVYASGMTFTLTGTVRIAVHG